PGNIVCQWTSGTTTYKLYESIEVSMTVTSGSWYIRDLYGFGYKGSVGSDPTVYVWIKVENPISPTSGVYHAYLIVYKAGTQVAKIDLTTGETYGSYSLSPGEAFQLDLDISIYNTGTNQVTYSFKVVFYVSQSTEQPR
ncbi:MAG: hypothetical protein ACP5GI_08580, partial [Sulfolobales archaeon]